MALEIVMIFALLLIYQIKHYFCDYLLQTEYMLGKFKRDGWVIPLTMHSLVHAVVTFAILVNFREDMMMVVYLSLFDFVAHFIMDRIKASPNLLGRFNHQQKEFWWAVGLDQMWHHLTHYVIIFAVLFL